MATEDLKKQTTISLIWNGFDKIGYQLIAMVVGVITARLLSPTDFGYIAALALFTMTSNVLVESGFSAALVRRKNNTQADYIAAFIFNVVLSLLFYFILYFTAPYIADYFKMPPLTSLARVLFLAIVINSITIIPNIILTRELRFKDLTISNLVGITVASIITIIMAVKGFGYWAIAAQQISQVAVKAVMLLIKSRWLPKGGINFKVIKEVLSFSILLIVSSLISNTVKYIYNFFIGPRYSSDDLGYYGQAFKFQNIVGSVITSTITGVSYPVLSSLNNDKERQMLYLQKLVRIVAFITFPIAIGLIVTTDNFISVILTDKWMPMARYFQLFLVGSMTTPFISQYCNYFTSIGKPNYYFLLEFFRNCMVIIMLCILNESINQLIIGFVIACYASLLLNSIVLYKHTGYSPLQQLNHILPALLISIVMGIVGIVVGKIDTATWIVFLLQIGICGIVYIGLSYIFKIQIMRDIIEIIKEKRGEKR